MAEFEKEIVKDPMDELESVSAPENGREGPIVDIVNKGIENNHSEVELIQEASKHSKQGGYHYRDSKRGHWSQSSGCSTKGYLNYVHRLHPDLEPLKSTTDTKRTFTHGDLIHAWIQGIFLFELGEQYVTIEERIDEQLEGEYGTAGHADIVIRGHDDFPDPFVIDIKSTTEFTYYSFPDNGHARSVPKESNLRQIMGYMYHIGADFGAILYYSKRNDNIEEYWTRFDDGVFKVGKRNIINVLDHVNAGRVPEPDAEPYMCDPKYCSYRREGICPGVKEAEKCENDGDRLEEFNFEDPEWA